MIGMRKWIRGLSFLFIFALMCMTFTGCSNGKVKNEDQEKIPVIDGNVTPEPEPVKPGKKEVDSTALQVSIDNSVTYQTIEGFGASYAWYSEWLTYNKHKDEIYDLLFKDAKLTVLRFKNHYKYNAEKDFEAKVELEIFNEAKKRAKEYGEVPTVLMSSWSPSADLKSNEVVYGDGTLRKNKKGEFVYDKFGKYWFALVNAYRDYGVPIDIISIQNECDFVASYDGCEFDIQESDDMAAYSKAYLAVYNALKKMDQAPKMMGPETMTIEAITLRMYMKDIFDQSPESVYGIAHHLYNGGTHTDPRSFKDNMTKVAELYPNISKWQTEFFRGNFIQTVELIQNSMIYENLNAYLYWGGVWQSSLETQCLIKLDPTRNPADFSLEKGYGVMEQYYALRHFSEYVRPGYQRIGTSVQDNENITCSAYVDKNQDNMVLIAINPTADTAKLQFQFEDYNLEGSKVILSDCSGEYAVEDLYKETGPLAENQTVELPANSIVTIVCNGKTDVETKSAVLGKNPDDEKNPLIVEINEAKEMIQKGDDPAWNTITPIEMKNVAYGDNGAVGSFQSAWKDNSLYVRIEVKDETKDVSGKDMANQDSVEFYLNESNAKSTSYGLGDVHFAVNRDGEVEAITGITADKIAAETTGDNNGYIITAEIPFKTFTAAAGKKIGFDIQINDSHNGGANAYILKWSDSSRYTNENLSKVGTLELK